MIVVDASVAAKWIFSEEYTTEARALLRTSLKVAEVIVAPSLLISEVTNIVRQRMRRGELTLHEALERVDVFLAIPVALQTSNEIFLRALEIASRYDLPSTYDAQYVAVADLLHCDLWTDDQRLIRALNGKMRFVRAISSHDPDG